MTFNRELSKLWLIPAVILTGSWVSSCAWQEPNRVEKDFGNSVRNMVAEQIYDPSVAATPSPDAPLLNGTAADASVLGYGQAAQGARASKTRQEGSPVPVTGMVDGSGSGE